MIIITCGKCGSTNVKKSHWHSEFDCKNCGSHLQLWQVKLTDASSSSLDMKVKVSEQTTASMR